MCTVCEDSSLARTGVTIQCDAGMCKAAFHVTWLVGMGWDGTGRRSRDVMGGMGSEIGTRHGGAGLDSGTMLPPPPDGAGRGHS